MHEMGIILHLAKTLEETAEQEQIKKITRVTLEVGEVSGILTDYFTDCWNYFRRKHPVLESAELDLQTLSAVGGRLNPHGRLAEDVVEHTRGDAHKSLIVNVIYHFKEVIDSLTGLCGHEEDGRVGHIRQCVIDVIGHFLEG